MENTNGWLLHLTNHTYSIITTLTCQRYERDHFYNLKFTNTFAGISDFRQKKIHHIFLKFFANRFQENEILHILWLVDDFVDFSFSYLAIQPCVESIIKAVPNHTQTSMKFIMAVNECQLSIKKKIDSEQETCFQTTSI